MKKQIGLILLGLFVFASAAYAVPNRAGKWDAGVNVSAAIPDDDGVDTGAYIGGNLSYGVNEWLGLGVSSGWTEFEGTTSGVTIEQTYVPLFGEFILRVPMPDQPFQPYGVIGLGAVFNSFDDNVPNVDIEDSTD